MGKAMSESGGNVGLPTVMATDTEWSQVLVIHIFFLHVASQNLLITYICWFSYISLSTLTQHCYSVRGIHLLFPVISLPVLIMHFANCTFALMWP